VAITVQTGAYVQTSAPPGVINLGVGQPSPRLLPIAAIAEAAAAQLHASADPLILQYGALLGYEGFRASLAAVLSVEYEQPVAADELMVTGGISSALTFVSEVFARPGATVVCEDPTYFLAAGVFRSAGLELTGVPVDDQGLDVDALEQRLQAGLRPALVYCIPAFQNPTGACLAPARARRLVALAETYDFVIVADEPYVLLDYSNGSAGSLTQYDQGRARVLSLGSFSKLLAPGLRLGWAHGAPSLIERLAQHGALRSGGCLNPVIAHIVHHTLDSGSLVAHVKSLREVFGARSRALSEALRERIPSARFVAPRGGYFCWIELGGDTEALLERATDLRFIPGNRCAVQRELGGWLRASVSFYEANELTEGVDRLAALLAL